MLSEGTVVAHRYRIGAPLGRGGAAHTYVADDLLFQGVVALKLLDPGHAVSELGREFEQARSVVHPHLTLVHDFAITRIEGVRRALYTAELVRGGDLAAYVRRVGLSAARPALGDVLDALHALHRLGLRHGDVKPENVLVREDGRAVLIDLGCAAPLGMATALPSGTPGYMAPELRAGAAADERADLFAFGVLLRSLGAAEGALARLADRLTSVDAAARPSSAREVLALMGDGRDVESATLGRAHACLGREHELAVTRARLEAVTSGEQGPRCVWVHGPPGVGRSRVLRELALAHARAGIDVLEARADLAAPLREALSRRHGAGDAGLEGLLDQLTEAAATPCVLVLDDAQALAPEADDELRLALRSLPAHGRLALLVASTQPPAEASAQVASVALGPLGEAGLAAWAGDLVEPARLAGLARFTGGYPRYVARVLGALAAGRLEPARLDARETQTLDDVSARALDVALRGLDAAEQRVLAQVAIDGQVLGSVPARLFARDLLARRGERTTLAREADREPLLQRLDARLVRGLRLVAARRLARGDAAPELAAAIAHFARAGHPRLAQRVLDRAAASAERAPAAFRALTTLPVPWTAEERILLARLARLAGAAPEALAQLARARRACATPALFREAAEVYLALGRPARAERMLARCGEPSAADASLHARVLVRRGAYARAGAVAERALAGADPAQRAQLLEASALASAYLGEHAQATARLDEAKVLHAADDLRARARSASLRGFVALRAGATARAVEAYEEAFSLAETEGLADLLVNALANLASARQSLGHWGRALATYERALRIAQALGRRTSACSLQANLANLALELGAFERARRMLAALDTAAESAALATSIALYHAEIALLEGDAAATVARIEALGPLGRLPPRERVEAHVLGVLAHVALGDAARAEQLLAQGLDEPSLPLDLSARVAESRARVLCAREQPRAALSLLEAAREQLRASDEPALTARLETALADVYTRLSADALARECADRARARWERIALDLPPALRDAFWAHPHRRALARRRDPARVPGRATLSLARVRELNRRLGALHTRDEVLRFALDAAIELTSAERGFVLLRQERGFEVAVAEHMDRERMPRSAWKWSRSIAERVIRDGEPVLTVDAERDPRFRRNESVHAMQLKSVLCAPIRGRSGMLGALYLDNRLARARFAPDDAELLLSFADQIAIAISHAELVAELEQRARELSKEKRKVELLARGQAREIERLGEVLTAQRRALGLTRDYDEIVGRSAPMRRLLSVLDRVVDTDLSVLVQGESGTGKELIARALHRHGRRVDRPFVSVNCAALPEALLESELFGHVKGAFTGALSAREGLFATARGGTLFLDELGELPMSMQAKLLRVLQDGEVRPVGATKSFSVDVRIVCATNRDLKQRVGEGCFREDLYYRVSVVELSLPSLRERHEDIVPLAEAILKKRAEQLQQPLPRLAPEAVRALLAHAWPGNVRELQNVLLRASVMAPTGVIGVEELELPSTSRAVRAAPTTRGEFRAREAERLLSALSAHGWNVSKVAKNLGIPRNTLYRKLARYGIQRT